jgi:hypothetical protein
VYSNSTQRKSHLWHDTPPESLRRTRKSPRKHRTGDNIGARDYILAIRLGLTFEGFEKMFLSQYGYNAMKMMDWFDTNYARFPEEFDWWVAAVHAMETE